MHDREKVIKGLECCMTGFGCPPRCPYLDDCNDLMKPMFVKLAKDTLALLEEQDAEMRQLKLALDIAKGTCKGIVFETDEKFMGDL